MTHYNETEETTPKYKVAVLDDTKCRQFAYLEPALQEDMPVMGRDTWHCNWQGFWQQADFDCEAIVKLSLIGELLGLTRFALYPFPWKNNFPQYLEIVNLECLPKRSRPVTPVGSWLLWYAAKVSLQYCTGEANGTLISLDSLEEAIPYYREKIGMDSLGWIDIAPGEQGHAFRFTREGAESFCRRQESKYGEPEYL